MKPTAGGEALNAYDIDSWHFPALPAALLKIATLSNDDRAAADDLARIIETDPALASRLLRLANSAAYGIKGPVTSVRRAVVVQGFGPTRELALHLLTFDTFSPARQRIGFDFLQFWQHSLYVALASKRIAAQLQHPEPDTLYLAGLLHDVGKILLATQGPLGYDEFLSSTRQLGGDRLEAERVLLGLGHDQLGAWCGERWQLPPALVRVQAQHHRFDLEALDVPRAPQEVAIVALADHIAWVQGIGSDRGIAPPSLNGAVFEHLDIAALDLPGVLQEADQEIARVAAFYGFDFPTSSRLRGNLIYSLLTLEHLKPAARRGEPRPTLAHSLTAPHHSLEPSEFIPRTLAALHEETGLARVMMWRVQAEARRLKLVSINPPSASGGEETPLLQEIPEALFSPLLRRSLRQRHPDLLEPADSGELLERMGCRKAVVAPVFNQGRLFGLLWLDNGRDGPDLDPRWTEEITHITRQLDIALANSTRFKREKRRAELDGLTGLLNRAALDRLLKLTFERHRQSGLPVTLGLVDVDRFKVFNDRFGHQAGDDVLKLVASHLNSLIRPGDILGRFGGDEFLFVLLGTDAEGAQGYAERARKAVERQGRLLEKRFTGHPLTLSIGLAAAEPGFATLAEWIAAADAALYRVKNDGRNQVATHSGT